MWKQLLSNPECLFPRGTTVHKLVQVVISTSSSIHNFSVQKRIPIYTGRDSRLNYFLADFKVSSFVEIPVALLASQLFMGEVFFTKHRRSTAE